MAYQKIRRAIAVPTFVRAISEETGERLSVVEENFGVMVENYGRLAREVLDTHNQIQVYQLAVTAAATTKVVTWSPAFYDVDYSAFGLPDWNTTIWYSAKTATSITFNFGTAAPGGGGNLLVLGIR